MRILKRSARVKSNVKRSVFIATIDRVDSVEEAKDFIKRISDEYRDATHNCWAYRVFEGSTVEHQSDAGEPSGSAGLPILNALREFELVNVAVVVTRYFGGVKLGISGLRKAYHDVVVLAVESAGYVEAMRRGIYKKSVNYGELGTVMGLLKRVGGRVVEMNYGNEGVIMVYETQEDPLDGELLREILVGVEG